MSGMQQVGKIGDIVVYGDKNHPARFMQVQKAEKIVRGDHLVHIQDSSATYPWQHVNKEAKSAKSATSDISEILDKIQVELYQLDGSGESKMILGEWGEENVDQAAIKIEKLARSVIEIIEDFQMKKSEIMRGK